MILVTILKTWKEGDVMTCCGRLFQTHERDRKWPITTSERSPMIVRRVRRTTSRADDAKRSLLWTWESAGWLKFGKLWWRRPVDTFEQENCDFEINLFLCFQPVKLTGGEWYYQTSTSRLVEQLHSSLTWAGAEDIEEYQSVSCCCSPEDWG